MNQTITHGSHVCVCVCVFSGHTVCLAVCVFVRDDVMRGRPDIRVCVCQCVHEVKAGFSQNSLSDCVCVCETGQHLKTMPHPAWSVCVCPTL